MSDDGGIQWWQQFQQWEAMENERLSVHQPSADSTHRGRGFAGGEMNTTLNAIREHSPCADGWAKLLRHLGKTQADDDPLPILTVLESNGLDDALWALRAVHGREREIRLFAVWCARQVQHLMTDNRIVDALDVAERSANGLASAVELAAAQDAAHDAARAAALAAARADARAAAGDAARAAACDAARADAWAAAWAAACDAQKQKLIEMCEGRQ